MGELINMKYIVGSAVYSLFGLFVFIVGFILFDKATPGNMWKEIIEEKNTALAILVGAVAIGISLIISSAIHG